VLTGLSWHTTIQSSDRSAVQTAAKPPFHRRLTGFLFLIHYLRGTEGSRADAYEEFCSVRHNDV
jgi:hypothetical protein